MASILKLKPIILYIFQVAKTGKMKNIIPKFSDSVMFLAHEKEQY